MSFQKLPSITVPGGSSVAAVIQAFNKLASYISVFVQNFIGKPQFNSILLSNITLNTGLNLVPHTLNTPLTGWSIVRQRGYCLFYDLQDFGQQPDVYLSLVASQPVVVDILVF